MKTIKKLFRNGLNLTKIIFLVYFEQKKEEAKMDEELNPKNCQNPVGGGVLSPKTKDTLLNIIMQKNEF
ncbi:hypothetical protein [Okeania sp. KiyG1]|uniref:hypothetical protein n=1 Tax=Okeania sp. KiyG1 TaxID=2720165 RepID=UPI0019213A19|nr:hypothetical protein [Okeania sp. KiyG1]GGA30566.1 hypothetical protein CYANOKiyG1_47100 [Okeania sp. KiyG1]